MSPAGRLPPPSRVIVLTVLTLIAAAVACWAAARQLDREAVLQESRRVSDAGGAAERRDDRCVRLLHEHDRALRRLAASYERDPSRQQDLVQEIWLAVWQALPRFRGECSERTFVFRIAHNRARQPRRSLATAAHRLP